MTDHSVRWTWAGAGLIVASAAGFVALFVGADYAVPPPSYEMMALVGALFTAVGAAGGYALWYGRCLGAAAPTPPGPRPGDG